MGLNKVTFLVFTPMLIAAGVACIRVVPEPTEQPIVTTPVAFRLLIEFQSGTVPSDSLDHEIATWQAQIKSPMV